MCASCTPAMAETQCGPSDKVTEALHNAGGFEVWTGLSDDGTLMILWQTVDGKRWKWTYSIADQHSTCMVDAGSSGQFLKEELKKDNKGSGI